MHDLQIEKTISHPNFFSKLFFLQCQNIFNINNLIFIELKKHLRLILSEITN